MSLFENQKGVWKSGSGKGRKFPKGRQPDDDALESMRSLLGEGPYRRDLLIEYLHIVQDTFGYLSAINLCALADIMRLSQAEVYEVATFYAHFDVVKEDDFFMTQAQLHSVPVRSRASVTGSIAKIEFIAPAEIRAADKAVIEENGELAPETLTKAVSDYFGFKRLGPSLKNGIDQALKNTF